jgi:hypothetical protein
VNRTPGRAWPIHPLLFAAYAVLFLFAENVAEVGLRDVVPPLGRSVIGAALALAVAGFLLRDLRRGAIVASALLAAFFGYGHVATVAGPDGPSRDVLLAGWALLVAVAAILAVRLDASRVASLTLTLDALAAVLVALALAQVAPPSLAAVARANEPLGDRPAPHAGDPDIWFLVFDRYGSEDALKRRLGIDNDLPEFLESRGFAVAREARANYIRTDLSLAATLRMDYLDDLIDQQGPTSTDTSPITAMLQDHVVGRTLWERGYRMYQLGSWFTPTSTSRIADVVLQPGRETDFEVLLRATTMLPLIDEYVTKPEIGHDDEQHREFGLFQLRALERLRAEPGPKFVFAHVLLPHPPYVFRADGTYPSDAERSAPEPERFRAQLAWLNGRLRELVDQILDAPSDRRPIVIVAADEGPYPEGYGGDKGTFDWSTATADDLAIKYGILQAIHLPGREPLQLPAHFSPVNTFRLVFSRAFGMDLPLLPDLSWTSATFQHPYDMTEITHLLPDSVPAD